MNPPNYVHALIRKLYGILGFEKLAVKTGKHTSITKK
jgi:hypothetical protein